MWTDSWIGLPFANIGRGQEGYDCLGLFIALHRARHGRELADPRISMSQAARSRFVDAQRPLWRSVEAVQCEGDAILFRVRGLPLHVGYAISASHMLHVEDGAMSVIEDFTTMKWRSRLEGIYTYAG